jgi:hypothetical protein
VGEVGAGVSAGADAKQAGPASALGPERRRRPDKVRNSFFLFLNKFQILVFDSNSNFEDEKDIFTNCSQNKICSKFYSLQLSFRALLKILNRF